MGQPKDARLASDVAQQICERTGSAAVLEGSIATLGRQYVLDLRASNCQTGNALDQEQAVAASREEVLNSLSQIARRFRTRVGESLSTVERYSTPLAEATTPSLEALKAYTTANKVNLSSGSAAAIPFFRRTVEIDPKFAMAHAYLGLLYSTIGESMLSVESTTKARQMRDRASDREKFFIDLQCGMVPAESGFECKSFFHEPRWAAEGGDKAESLGSVRGWASPDSSFL
jgi:eukaryotic-like serine/threonine-protein kinase